MYNMNKLIVGEIQVDNLDAFILEINRVFKQNFDNIEDDDYEKYMDMLCGNYCLNHLEHNRYIISIEAFSTIDGLYNLLSRYKFKLK